MTSHRRFVALLVAIVLATSGLLHALCAPMAAAADGRVPLCTAAGVTWLPAGDPSDPANPAHDDDCPACQAGHCGASFVPPPRVHLAMPAQRPAQPGVSPPAAFAPARFLSSTSARGPPNAN